MDKQDVLLKNISPSPVKHGNGVKFIFKKNEELNNNLTQIAYGSFLPGESCDFHVHPTMDEYFFFIKGEGVYNIGEKAIKIVPNTFLEIKSGIKHQLIAKGEENLEFVYWGVAK
jgi:mannose-6-phosphate isomerase-like protein (cupin superfamily)